MPDYSLSTDSTQIKSITTERVMVAAALLYTFTVFVFINRYIMLLSH